jgi:protein-L-isoaspartate O-methyltransferase
MPSGHRRGVPRPTGAGGTAQARGRMVIPVGPYGVQNLVQVDKDASGAVRTRSPPRRLRPMLSGLR